MTSFYQIVGMSLLVIFIMYITTQLLTNTKEGMTSTITNSGEAGDASSYNATIKAQTIKLQDELLVQKYKKDYEDVILQMDDYLGNLMLKQVLNIDMSGKTDIQTSLAKLVSIKEAKDALNVAIKVLDSQ